MNREASLELAGNSGWTTGNPEAIHNRETIWETSLDSLRNQAIALKFRLLSIRFTSKRLAGIGR